MQKILDTDEKECLVQALRSHVDFLESTIAARNSLGGAANIIAAALDGLAKSSESLRASIASASVISLELPDA